MSRINFDDYDTEEYEAGFVKSKSKTNGSRKKGKGHQGRYEKSEREIWAEMETIDVPKKKAPEKKHYQKPSKNYDDEKGTIENKPTPSYNKDNQRKPQTVAPKQPTVAPQVSLQDQQQRPTHVFGPNTREIKGVQIDMDGVVNIEKIENLKDGKTTFGIKFTFKGSKGLFRTIWYNVNIRARDAAYNVEYEFWTNLNRR